MTTREGRHLVAGALAILSLAAVEILIAAIPLYRGERWAFWASLIPVLSLVLPVMLVDARYVTPERLPLTVAPFVVGLLLVVVGLVLVRPHPRSHAS